MDWVEVPPAEWQAFLGKFSDEHRGWRAAIDQHQPGHIPERLVEGLPLQLILAEQAGFGVNDIAIVAGEDDSDAAGHLLHRICQARHVRVAQSHFRNDIAVSIEPAGGPSTVLHVWKNEPG